EVLKSIKQGKLDYAHLSVSNFVDDIILSMNSNGVLDCIDNTIQDKRHHNKLIPFKLIMALSVVAKMKVKTSLTDIPYAIQDHKVLADLGYTLIDNDGLNNGLMSESGLRFLLNKYESTELFETYNNIVQKSIMPKLNIETNIHILDCTKLEVNTKNFNYENASASSDGNGGYIRGYKLATLRGVTGDVGIIEDIRFGAINIHDLTLSEEMLKTTNVFKKGDILINDRGFLSRDLLNYLKTVREVDTYIPLRKNMQAYNIAIQVAQDEDIWIDHPSRKHQKITQVMDLGVYWEGKNIKDDVQINACVVWDYKYDEYFVFITTDLTKNAKQIIMTYELRPEIEEDYRQLKDFWKLEDFKSTKINVIAFHIICVLLGYLFFQLYVMLEDDSYAHKSLPIVLKNYDSKALSKIIVYVGDFFGIFDLVEFMDIYANLDEESRIMCQSVLRMI
ncbi:MAG: transposase, partial [Lachnospirales bacterium]